MIPKVIHYCWFGRNKKPELAEKCIKSWEKYCKDYQIIEWNEDNFNIEDAPLYVRQAYEAKKWAFVTDYVRLWAMTTYGGIYMDTDVEVIKPLDKFLKNKAFSGFEDGRNIPTGIMACEKGFPLFEHFLHYYDTASFLNEDGSCNTTTNVTIMTNICIEKGLIQDGTYQEIEGFSIYPKQVFCPLAWDTGLLKKNRKTVTIHWFAGSWHTEEQAKGMAEYRKRKRVQLKADKRDRLRHLPNRILSNLLGKERYEKFKNKLK